MSRVNGLLMISDDMVISENLLSRPLIISQVGSDENDTYSAYAWNKNNSYFASLQHVFIEKCYILNPIYPTHLALAGAWALVGLGWYILSYKIFLANTYFLQKILFLIPCSKCLECLINGLFYNACPWLGAQNPSEKYLEMARISIITIVYTIMLALLYILSKGWQTLIFYMNRNQATNLTMIMGAVYLTYSAYFLSSDFSSISVFMRVMMTLLFLGIGFVNIKSIKECIIVVNAFRRQANVDDPNNNIMGPALELKQKNMM